MGTEPSQSQERPLWSKCLAEGVGTFVLVFCGTGAIVVDGLSGGQLGHVGVALTFGLVVTAMVYTFGEVSGAHINPAVTIAFWAAGRFAARRILPYVGAQVLGAISASLLLRWLFPDAQGLGATVYAGPVAQALVLEAILTFVLMLVIIHVATGSREVGTLAGIAIGATVALEALFAGQITGASMNPARSLGPALVGGEMAGLWLYVVGPVAGGLLGVGVWQLTGSQVHALR